MIDEFGPAWLEQTATQAQRNANSTEAARHAKQKRQADWLPPISTWDRAYSVLRIAVPAIAVVGFVLLLFLMG